MFTGAYERMKNEKPPPVGAALRKYKEELAKQPQVVQMWTRRNCTVSSTQKRTIFIALECKNPVFVYFCLISALAYMKIDIESRRIYQNVSPFHIGNSC